MSRDGIVRSGNLEDILWRPHVRRFIHSLRLRSQEFIFEMVKKRNDSVTVSQTQWILRGDNFARHSYFGFNVARQYRILRQELLEHYAVISRSVFHGMFRVLVFPQLHRKFI